MSNNYLWAAIITGVVTPIVGFIIYRLKARVDTKKLEEDTPLKLLERMVVAKDQELTESRAVINARLEKDGVEREHLAQVLTESLVILKNLQLDGQAHREEERIRSSAFHAKLEEIHRDAIRGQAH